MAQASQLSPELAQGLQQLARALLAAVRNWTLYPPEHPAVGVSIGRLADAIRQSSMGAAFAVGITPETLMVEGTPANRNEAAIAEAAALLHDRDLIHIMFVGAVSQTAIHALLRTLTLDPAERRRRGGPAKIWAADGDPSVILEQIDYDTCSHASRAAIGPKPAATISGAPSSCRSPAARLGSSTSPPSNVCSRSQAARSRSERWRRPPWRPSARWMDPR